MIGSEVRMYLGVLIIAVALGLAIRFARGETPDEWFRLVIELQNRQEQLDPEERRFVANVINRLTVSENAIPTPEHQRWLLNIKARLQLHDRNAR
jgi:hypothetical protein